MAILWVLLHHEASAQSAANDIMRATEFSGPHRGVHSHPLSKRLRLSATVPSDSLSRKTFAEISDECSWHGSSYSCYYILIKRLCFSFIPCFNFYDFPKVVCHFFCTFHFSWVGVWPAVFPSSRLCTRCLSVSVR